MHEKRCIHEFLPGQCGLCVDIPFGITETVYITKHGRAFHIWKDCEYLDAGQKFAVSKGGTATEIISMTWRSANSDHYPCEWCCALYYTKGQNLEECLIVNNEGEIPACIVKDRYVGKNIREFQIFYPETDELEILTNRYVKRFK